MLPSGHELVEGDLLQRGTQTSPHLDRMRADVEPADHGPSCRRMHQGRQDADGRGLPGPVAAEISEDLALLDPEADSGKSLNVCLFVSLLKVAHLDGERLGHARNSPTAGRSPLAGNCLDAPFAASPCRLNAHRLVWAIVPTADSVDTTDSFRPPAP